MNKVNTQSRRRFLQYGGGLALAAGGLGIAGCATAVNTSKSVAFPAPIAARNGKNIRTVRGLMAPEYLGVTDMHEHVLRDYLPSEEDAMVMFDDETLQEMAMLSDPGEVPQQFFPEPGNPITLRNRHYLTHFYASAPDQFLLDKNLMMGELKDFAALGGQSILDCSPTYERGNPLTIRQMSEETGVNVIMSTGINSHVLIPKKYKQMTVSGLADFFEHEIEVGIGDTGIQCGNIKLLAESSHFGVKATEDIPLLNGLQAAAAISRNSGVPITLHAYLLKEEVFRAFFSKVDSFGVPEGRMIISHFPTLLRPMHYRDLMKNPKGFLPNLDLGYWAMDQGHVLSFDLFGSGHAWADTSAGLVPTYDPVSFSAIYQYVKAGYGDRIVLGADVWMRNSTRENGGAGMAHILNFVVPTLLENGLTQQEIDQIMIHTPARMLAF
ncbi:phosphotriesterase [Oceanobacter kriegii]|uniref:phosphotriesterase n=1 Tax=Oceanobacter kriegii TaxID=64972 RepID=UPI0004035D3D|nr:phosphotriesterase [Oceanobacter kriegii]